MTRQESINQIQSEYKRYTKSQIQEIGKCVNNPTRYANLISKYSALIDLVRSTYPEVDFSTGAALGRMGSDYKFCPCCDSMLKMHKSLYTFSTFCSAKCRASSTINPMAESIIIDGTAYASFPLAMESTGLSRFALRCKIFDKFDVLSRWEISHEHTCLAKLKASHQILIDFEYIIQWKDSGKSIDDLAEFIQIDKQSVMYAYLFFGIQTQFDQLSNEATIVVRNKESFATMFSNMSAEEMARKLCTTPGTVLSYARQYGIETNRGFQKSRGENELFEFVSDIRSDAVQGVRGKIPSRAKMEIDIFIPSLNIGIEYNGCYTHSIDKKDKNYHSEKTKLFSDQGIRIIHIWEDSWDTNREVIKNFLKNILSSNTERTYARNGIVSVVSKEEAIDFFDKHHIQGAPQMAETIGLFLDGVLVSAMAFQKIAKNVKKLSNGNGVELVRFANINCVGSFSKLLVYYAKTNDISYVTSFADLDIVDPTNNVYMKNGFSISAYIPPDYKYFDPRTKKREHKFKYRKSYFSKLGIDITDKTEWELAKDHRLLRCYDSGKIRYVWVK